MRTTLSVAGGEIPLLVDDRDENATFILAHGAGSHLEHKTISELAEVMAGAGLRVVRFNFLYRSQGRSMPDRMPTLIETYRAVIDWAMRELNPAQLLIGGHSMGSRVASMLESEEPQSQGLVLFGYPLHPAGQPTKLRDAHLAAIRTRTLCFNGTEDALCTPALMETVLARLDPNLWTMHWLEGADHSYAVRKSTGKTRAQILAEIGETVRAWLGDQPQ